MALPTGPIIAAIAAKFANNGVTMATRNVSQTISFFCFNVSTGAYVTGQTGPSGSGSLTLRWLKDGVSAQIANTTITEVDSTNAPGEYTIVLSQAETNCLEGTLAGMSSTSNVIVLPTQISFDYIPNAAPGAANGSLIAGSNAATTFTGGITVTQSVLNGAGISVTGNGSGAGLSITGGSTGNGVTAAGGGGNTSGISAAGVGTQDGMQLTGGLTGRGLRCIGGGTSGAGFRAEGSGANADGIESVATGTGSAFYGMKMTKNVAVNNFMFVMYDAVTHLPKTGLTVTAKRSLDGAAFGACANSVSEVSDGVYKLNLAAGDTNGNTVALLFSATGADASLVTLVTQ